MRLYYNVLRNVRTIINSCGNVEIKELFMNTPNNKRRKESIEKIEKVFLDLLQIKDLDKISVSDICIK